MKRLFLLLILAVAATTAIQAKSSNTKNDSIYIIGNVRDKFTRAAVPDIFITLMRPDSTVVDTMRTRTYNSYSYGFGESQASYYSFTLKAEPASYIFKLEHPEFETTYTNYTIKKINKRTNYIEGPELLIRRTKRKQTDSIDGGLLGEVVVKATKVKMVWKGDTLVFNADAFNVPEGSMLDGLIKQLPGVELNDNGEIFVNGKKIDNLTLNGADFFRGKNKIMLENLPYFTVKDIKVYNKQTEENKFLGNNDEDKKEYTMDVTLKKEYRGGGTANVEAGYGTDDRYKVKAFGMLFNDNIRAMVFGGLNNVNESTEYDTEGEESSRTNASGDRHIRQLGGMFAYRSNDNEFNTSLNVNSTWTDDKSESRNSSETFLDTGNSFSRSMWNSHSKPVSLEATNRTEWRCAKTAYMYSNLRVNYRHSTRESFSQGLTTTDFLMTDSVNSTLSRSWSRSNSVSANGNVNISKLINSANDYITLSLNASGNKTYTPQSFSQSLYRYHKTHTDDYRNNYNDNAPKSYSYSAQLAYSYNLSKTIRLSPHYAINSSYNNSDNIQYRLDQLGEAWASDSEHNFRSLPSTRDSMLLAIDLENSRSQTTRSLRHDLTMDISFNGTIKKDKGYYYGSIQMPLYFDRNSMNYYSQAITTDITRHYTTFEPYFYTYIGTTGKNRKNIRARYNIRKQKPSIYNLIDYSITSDPLNITTGNPNLKMETSHYYHIEASTRCDSINQMMSILFDGNFTHDAFANGYTYNPETGVRTYRAENIANGNWYFNTRLNYGRDLGKKKYFHFDAELSYTLEKSTDLANVTGNASSVESSVKTNELKIKPALSYQRGKLSLFLQQRTQWRNYRRSITTEMQLPDNTWDISWTFRGNCKLPYNFSVNTSLELRQRRGYADSEMNDNRIFWDATITKSFKAGRWLLKLRGYDLLGQVSNLRYQVNAQGRSETWTNSMRRYALLTVAYKFTQKKKE